VHDLSDVHNFALGNQTTNTRLFTGGIEFVGDETFTLDLAPGSYAYACSAHPDTMNGRFRVIAAAPPPVATKTLSAKVTSGAVSLSAKAVTAGPYKLTVADRSRSRNFHVVGPGVNRRTGKTFMGSVTWRLELAAGKYKFGSDPRLTGRLVVRGAAGYFAEAARNATSASSVPLGNDEKVSGMTPFAKPFSMYAFGLTIDSRMKSFSGIFAAAA